MLEDPPKFLVEIPDVFDLVPLLIWNGYFKVLFQRHADLDDVKGICAKIGRDFCFQRQLVTLNVKLTDEDVLNGHRILLRKNVVHGLFRLHLLWILHPVRPP